MARKTILMQIGAALAVAASGGGLTYYVSNKSTSVLEGVVEIDAPNDGGVWKGRVYGLISTVRAIDGGTLDTGVIADANVPDSGAIADSGVKPDSGGTSDSGIKPDSGQPSGPDGAVAGLYEPSYRGPVVAGRLLTQLAATAPAVGEWVEDVTHGTRSRRLPGYHQYSQLQAFSQDESMLLLTIDGRMTVIERESLKVVTTVTGNTPRWRRGTNKLIYMLDTPARVLELDPRTGVTTQLVQLGALYAYREQSWEDTSQDGRVLAALVHDGNGARVRIVTVDLAARTVLATKELASLPCTGGINWVSPGTTGESVVIQWNGDGYGRCRGVERWRSSDLSYVQHVWAEHPHSDHCILDDGREFLGTVINTAPWGANGNPALAMGYYARPIPVLNQWGAPVWTADGTTTAASGVPANITALRTVGWQAFHHVSCKGPAGWVLFTGGSLALGTQLEPFRGEVYLMRVTAGGAETPVNRIAWHRSNSGDYWAQPKATLSPSGKFALYATDWFGTHAPTSYLVNVTY